MSAQTFTDIIKFNKDTTQGLSVKKAESTQQFHIYKTDEDKRLIFGWGSVAIRTDGEQVVDLQNDLIDPEDLEEAVYEYVLDFRDGGEEHIPKLRKKARLVESVVFTKEKMKAMGIPEGTVPEGWWLGFYIDDDEAWKKVKNGTYQMFSIEGQGIREEVKDDIDKADRINGCGIIVLNGNKILTATRIGGKHGNQICGPGGHIEAGESHEEAAIRETYEEFGIDCQELEPLGILDGGRNYGKSAVFLCTEYKGEPHTDEEEMTDLKWRTIDELREEKLFWPFEQSLDLIEEMSPEKRHTVAKTFNEILKFNPYHDDRGRFSNANGYASFTYAPGKSRAHDLAIQREKQRHAANQSGTEKSGSDEVHSLKPGKITYESDDFGKPGTYVVYRNGHIQKKGMIFTAPKKENADSYATSNGGSADRLTQEYEIKLNKPLVINGVTDGDCLRQAYQTLNPGKTIKGGITSSKWIAADKANARALDNSTDYDSIVYMVNGKPQEIQISAKRASELTQTAEYTTTKWSRLGWTKQEAQQKGLYNQDPQDYKKVNAVGKAATVAKTFDEILKFNPYHDAKGRFSTSNGYASFTTRTKDPKKQHWADKAVQRLKQQAPAAPAAPATPPKPKVNRDRLGFADHDDADYHQLGNRKNYYQQQQLTPKQKTSVSNYLEAHTEPGSLYSHSQNLNMQMATGQTLKGKYKQTYDGLMSSMHNIGINAKLTRYDHPDTINAMLKTMGAGTDYSKMNVTTLKKALVGKSFKENKFISCSTNDFQNAPVKSKNVFTNRAVKVVYKAKADVQAMMPGHGAGGDLGEMILAPTNGTTNRGGTITGVRFTGQKARRKGTQLYDMPQIEITVEI